MKTENININPNLSGIPVEFDGDEPWRKTRFSCSGAGRVEKNFDKEHMTFMFKYKSDNSDPES